MKKKFITSFIISTALLVVVSCDDFVDADPPYKQDADNFFRSPEDYDKALTAAYDLLQTTFNNLWIGEIASDNSIAGGESVTDSEGLHQIDAMTHGGVPDEPQTFTRAGAVWTPCDAYRDRVERLPS